MVGMRLKLGRGMVLVGLPWFHTSHEQLGTSNPMRTSRTAISVTTNAQLRKGALSQLLRRLNIQGSRVEIPRETITRGWTWVCDREDVVCVERKHKQRWRSNEDAKIWNGTSRGRLASWQSGVVAWSQRAAYIGKVRGWSVGRTDSARYDSRLRAQ